MPDAGWSDLISRKDKSHKGRMWDGLKGATDDDGENIGPKGRTKR